MCPSQPKPLIKLHHTIQTIFKHIKENHINLKKIISILFPVFRKGIMFIEFFCNFYNNNQLLKNTMYVLLTSLTVTVINANHGGQRLCLGRPGCRCAIQLGLWKWHYIYNRHILDGVNYLIIICECKHLTSNGITLSVCNRALCF